MITNVLVEKSEEQDSGFQNLTGKRRRRLRAPDRGDC